MKKGFLLISVLLLFGLRGFAGQNYPNFPKEISLTTFNKLSIENKYAFLRDLGDRLQTHIDELIHFQTLSIDIDAVEEHVRNSVFSIPHIEQVNLFSNINSWHIHMLLRFLSQLPVNAYTPEQKERFEVYWHNTLNDGVGHLAYMAGQLSLPEVLKTHFPAVTAANQLVLGDVLMAHIRESLHEENTRTFENLSAALNRFAESKTTILRGLGVTDRGLFQEKLNQTFQTHVSQHQFNVWISFIAADTAAFKLSDEALTEEKLWADWNGYEGFIPFSDDGPGEEIWDYILTPRELRIAVTLIGEYHSTLRLRGGVDITTYTDISADISPLRYPQLLMEYSGIIDVWNAKEAVYDQHITSRIDIPRIRPILENESDQKLLIQSPHTTISRHKLLWGTIQGKKRTLTNPSEDRLISLLKETKALLNANSGLLVNTYKTQNDLETLEEAEQSIIDGLSEDHLDYTPTFWYTIQPTDFFDD